MFILVMISLTKDDLTVISNNLDLNKTNEHDMIIIYIRISSRALIHLNHALRVATFHQTEKSKFCLTIVDILLLRFYYIFGFSQVTHQ